MTQLATDHAVTAGWEMHSFGTVTRHSDGRETQGTHQEAIHTSVTHLVMVPYDEDKPGEPDVMVVRAWSIEEAQDIARCHHAKDIWGRLPNRSFAPLEAI